MNRASHRAFPLLAVLFLLVTVNATGVLIPLSIQDLVRRADLILLADTGPTTFWKQPSAWIYERTRLTPVEVLQGDPPPEGDLEVVTRRRDPAKGRMEDPYQVFPIIGTRVLVFLTRTPSGEWKPSDVHFSIRELRSDEKAGFAFLNPHSPSLARIRSIIQGK